MVYTEIKNRNNRKYYYRVLSIRNKNKVTKQRQYLGVNLSHKELLNKEKDTDKKFNIKTEDKIKKTLEKIKYQIIKVLKNNKIKKAGIFGSYARGENKKSSDIDILIQPEENMSLFDISGLKIELEEILRKRVDLISYKYIHPSLKEEILKSEVKII